MTGVLQFDAFESAVDVAFWESLAKKKMDIFKLDDSIIEISGFYQKGRRFQSSSSTSSTSTSYGMPCRISVTSASLTRQDSNSRSVADYHSFGFLKNTNTLNGFKDLDKNAFLKQCAQKVLVGFLVSDDQF